MIEHGSTVQSVKAVQFHYKPSEQILDLLETFKQMVNEAIHICLTEHIQGRLNLRNRIYREFQDKYNVVSCYPYSVAEVAWSIVKKHRKWQRKPYAKHLMLKMDSHSYSLNYSILSLPFKKGERILIPLEYGDYQRSFLMDKTLKRGSVTMTDCTIVIAFSKETEVIETRGKVAYDSNEASLVGVNSQGETIFHDLSKAAYDKLQYRMIRAKIAQSKHNDLRVKTKLLDKYGERERNRVKQALHRVSKKIVEHAKVNRLSIVLENLKHIRKSSRKGNGMGNNLRGRLNSWSFRDLQSQIQYKASWEGIPVEHVRAARTSQICSQCGHINKDLKYEREWQCPTCGVILDRDLNAAKNILTRSLLPSAPLRFGGQRAGSEAMEPLVMASRSSQVNSSGDRNA